MSNEATIIIGVIVYTLIGMFILGLLDQMQDLEFGPSLAVVVGWPLVIAVGAGALVGKWLRGKVNDGP